MKISVLKVVGNTAADGPGLRTSVYLAGCSHRCPGCHNPQSWNIENGTRMEIDDLIEEIESYGNKKVTLTGGDPFYQVVPLYELLAKLKERNYNIWVYTGFTFEELATSYSLDAKGYLRQFIDGLVDGRFEQDKKDTSLRFRGSSNQRIFLRDSQGILREDTDAFSS